MRLTETVPMGSISSEPADVIFGEKSRMWNLSIQQLTTLIDGQLLFGKMPPLGGGCDPIGRIVPTDALLRKDDVVVVGNDQDSCLEQWFLSGATGVVATRGCEPLAGCFCVVVTDTEQALKTLAAFQRNEYPGRLVLEVTAETGPGTDREDLYWQLVELDHDHAESRVVLSVDDMELIPWCHPEELVVDETVSVPRRNSLLNHLPPRTVLRKAA